MLVVLSSETEVDLVALTINWSQKLTTGGFIKNTEDLFPRDLVAKRNEVHEVFEEGNIMQRAKHPIGIARAIRVHSARSCGDPA